MASISCILFWAGVPLLIVLAVIAWFLETDRERARRWRRSGVSQREIARRLGCSRHRVVRLLAQPMT
jgi:DNA-binding CsgD family transcriptional regulator